MFKMTIVAWRRPDWSIEECRRWWLEEHAPIARRMPGLRGYIINLAQRDEAGAEPELMGTDDLFFDSEEAFEKAWNSPEWREARAHTAAAGIKAIRSFVNEVRIIDPVSTGIVGKSA